MRVIKTPGIFAAVPIIFHGCGTNYTVSYRVVDRGGKLTGFEDSDPPFSVDPYLVNNVVAQVFGKDVDVQGTQSYQTLTDLQLKEATVVELKKALDGGGNACTVKKTPKTVTVTFFENRNLRNYRIHKISFNNPNQDTTRISDHVDCRTDDIAGGLRDGMMEKGGFDESVKEVTRYEVTVTGDRVTGITNVFTLKIGGPRLETKESQKPVTNNN